MLLLRRCRGLTLLSTRRYDPVTNPYVTTRVLGLHLCEQTGIVLLSLKHTAVLETQFFFRLPVAPAVASCAVRLRSSSAEDQGSYQRAHRPGWRHAVAGLLAGTGAVLAYGLHQHKVSTRLDL